MKALAAVVLVATLAACGGTGDGDGDLGGSPRRLDVPTPPSSSAAPGPATDLASTEVCDLVRQGIDAFNVGDLDGTIERFEAAEPLAEELAEDQPSDDTATLLDAVRYYAELPADEYAEANESSPEFLRFKDFTLTECAYTGAPGEPSDTGVPA